MAVNQVKVEVKLRVEGEVRLEARLTFTALAEAKCEDGPVNCYYGYWA